MGTRFENGIANRERSPEDSRSIERIGGLFDREEERHQAGSIYNPEGLLPTIDPSEGGYREPIIANTIDANGYLRRGKRDRNKNGKAILTSIAKRRIRRLTPKECERLQGFPDDWTKVPAIGNDAGIELGCKEVGESDEIIKGKVMSDTQRYKQIGNAVSIPVIEAIGEAIGEAIIKALQGN